MRLPLEYYILRTEYAVQISGTGEGREPLMQEPFEIKGKRIGEGRPLICIPVTEAGEEQIAEKVCRLTEHKAQMIEWRVDCFAGAAEPERVRAVLERISPLVQETVMLFTFRTRKQGGNGQLPEKSRSCSE